MPLTTKQKFDNLTDALAGLLGKLFGKGSAAALLLAVFLISGTAWATYNSYGVGNASCGAWTEDKKTEGASYWQKAEWIFGYLTAYSRWVEGPVLGPVGKSDVSGTRAWVDNYCQENPLELVAEAAEQLIGAIEAQ